MWHQTHTAHCSAYGMQAVFPPRRQSFTRGEMGNPTTLRRTCSTALLAVLVFPSAGVAQTNQTPLDCDSVMRTTADFMEDAAVPGAAVAILNRGEPICVVTRGLANMELGVPVTRHTVFELASLTKQMTAALVLTLAGDGILSPDDRLTTYVAEGPAGWDPITLRQLLGHMAGLGHAFEPKAHGSYLVEYDTETMLEGAASTPMVSRPGTDWEYSDQGYFLAGLFVERATDRRFDELMTERLFVPLGMTNTRFLDQHAIIPNRAAGYTVVDGDLQNNRRVWQFELTPHFGVMSTIDDMIRWERGLVLGHVVPSDATEEITAPYRVFFENGDHRMAYGMGWQIHDFGDRRIVEHSGYTGTHYMRDLTTGLSVIILTNRDSNAGPHPSILAKRIARLADPDFPLVE